MFGAQPGQILLASETAKQPDGLRANHRWADLRQHLATQRAAAANIGCCRYLDQRRANGAPHHGLGIAVAPAFIDRS